MKLDDISEAGLGASLKAGWNAFKNKRQEVDIDKEYATNIQRMNNIISSGWNQLKKPNGITTQQYQMMLRDYLKKQVSPEVSSSEVDQVDLGSDLVIDAKKINSAIQKLSRNYIVNKVKKTTAEPAQAAQAEPAAKVTSTSGTTTARFGTSGTTTARFGGQPAQKTQQPEPKQSTTQKPRVNIGRAATGTAQAAPAQAAPVNMDSVKRYLQSLNRKEKQRLLLQLANELGQPIN